MAARSSARLALLLLLQPRGVATHLTPLLSRASASRLNPPASSRSSRIAPVHMTSASVDPYSVLGVPRGASRSEIKIAYRKLALLYHPDRNSLGDAKIKFMEVTQESECSVNRFPSTCLPRLSKACVGEYPRIERADLQCFLLVRQAFHALSKGKCSQHTMRAKGRAAPRPSPFSGCVKVSEEPSKSPQIKPPGAFSSSVFRPARGASKESHPLQARYSARIKPPNKSPSPSVTLFSRFRLPRRGTPNSEQLPSDAITNKADPITRKAGATENNMPQLRRTSASAVAGVVKKTVPVTHTEQQGFSRGVPRSEFSKRVIGSTFSDYYTYKPPRRASMPNSQDFVELHATQGQRKTVIQQNAPAVAPTRDIYKFSPGTRGIPKP
ncbi:MAG: hypothetical protein SGPRY_011327 [Prymnesium sp.]